MNYFTNFPECMAVNLYTVMQFTTVGHIHYKECMPVLLLYTVILYYITFGVVNACMLSAKQTKLKNKVTPINFDRLTLHDLVKLCIVPQVYSTDHQGFSLQPAMLQWCIEDVCAWMLHVHKH